MAGLGWLRTGTITVTNGSRNVGGTDTLWSGGVVNPGDIILLPNGGLGEIESVGSNTALTLKQAYTGATASAQPYAIIRMLPSGNVAADLAAQFTATSQRYHLTLDQFVSFLDSTGIVSFSDGDTTLSGLHGLRKLMADIARRPATDASGNLGLGTTAPRARLEVVTAGAQYNAAVAKQADAGAGVLITSSESDTAGQVGLFMRGADLIGGGISVAREDGGATWRTRMRFFTNNITGGDVTAVQEKACLTSDGYLGIGSTAPTAKLHVAGTARIDAPMRLAEYTLSTLPSASAYSGHLIIVSNATGGAAMCRSDGSAWINLRTNAAVA